MNWIYIIHSSIIKVWLCGDIFFIQHYRVIDMFRMRLFLFYQPFSLALLDHLYWTFSETVRIEVVLRDIYPQRSCSNHRRHLFVFLRLLYTNYFQLKQLLEEPCELFFRSFSSKRFKTSINNFWSSLLSSSTCRCEAIRSS